MCSQLVEPPTEGINFELLTPEEMDWLLADEWLDELKDGCLYGWLYGWMVGWLDGRMDG